MADPLDPKDLVTIEDLTECKVNPRRPWVTSRFAPAHHTLPGSHHVSRRRTPAGVLEGSRGPGSTKPTSGIAGLEGRSGGLTKRTSIHCGVASPPLLECSIAWSFGWRNGAAALAASIRTARGRVGSRTSPNRNSNGKIPSAMRFARKAAVTLFDTPFLRPAPGRLPPCMGPLLRLDCFSGQQLRVQSGGDRPQGFQDGGLTGRPRLRRSVIMAVGI